MASTFAVTISITLALVASGIARPAAGAEPKFKIGSWPLLPLVRPAVPKPTPQPIATPASRSFTNSPVPNAPCSPGLAAESGAEPNWTDNPIDAFVLDELQKKGLRPSAPADREMLLRRVTFDLVGLPPTPVELAAFLSDMTSNAYRKVVDRLLASPRYGERWAQHWLDLVRYAETAGFKKDDVRPNAYKYRDYVIASFNSDLSYDTFLTEQIAGDETEPENPAALVATGLNRLYPEETNASNFLQARQQILDDLTEVTGLAFMGLTIGCARCHDHKFDPILQTDFYRLQAFFSPILPNDDAAALPPAELRQYESRLDQWEAATADIRGQLDKLLDPERKEAVEAAVEACDPATQLAVETPPEKRTSLQMQLAELAEVIVQRKLRRIEDGLDADQKRRYTELTTRLAAYDSMKPATPPLAMAVTDTGLKPPPTFCLAAGDYSKPTNEVRPGFPESIDASEPNVETPAAAPHSTGRRTALAHWLTEPNHPLTARVMMNRVWGRHFGAGIVATENDFGAMGAAPSHEKLLDWLAAEFVARGWKLKAMHRLIVTSAAYRQASAVDLRNPDHAAAVAADPEDKLLWHFPRRRLEGEAIRDAALAIAGQLNLRMFGPSAKPELPAALRSSRYAWEPDAAPEDRDRRSIYVFARRNLRDPLLAAFDPADLHNSCSRRSSTVTAPQALTLLNGELLLAQARRWSGQLLSEYPTADSALVEAAYRAAYARSASADEVAAAETFLREQAARIAEAGPLAPKLLPEPAPACLAPADAAAVVDMCHAILNSSEFLFVD